MDLEDLWRWHEVIFALQECSGMYVYNSQSMDQMLVSVLSKEMEFRTIKKLHFWENTKALFASRILWKENTFLWLVGKEYVMNSKLKKN